MKTEYEVSERRELCGEETTSSKTEWTINLRTKTNPKELLSGILPGAEFAGLIQPTLSFTTTDPALATRFPLGQKVYLVAVFCNAAGEKIG